MEQLFKALSNRDALWVVMYLAAEGPRRQTDLIDALRDSRPGRPARNSGSMSNLVAPLLRAGVLEKDKQSDELKLASRDQVRRLLTLASAIAVARTSESSREADEQHAELMRAITQASPTRDEASTTSEGAAPVQPRRA
jgi:hypothetical protein